jgi:type II secretion system protein N
MRLPRLRLPQVRVSLDWMGSLVGRTTLLYVGYTAVLFVVFLLLTFPHDLLVRAALSRVNNGPVAVDFGAVNFAWFKGYELTGMRLRPQTDGQPPYLECSRVWARPLLSALVRGNPYGLALQADLYGGVARGEVKRTDGQVVGNIEWQDLHVDRYRTLTALLDEGQLAGRVSGQFAFELSGRDWNAGQGSGEISVDGVGLTSAKIGGVTVPDLHLQKTKLKFVVRNGRFEIQEFNASGDLTVQGSGHIVLRDPVQESVLNLKATILPTPTTPDALKAALALIPRAAGTKPDAPVTLTGTLARPRVR